MPTPANPDLYRQAREKVMRSYPKSSAYSSGAIVKEYKRLGGTYIDDNKPRNLQRWFREGWRDVNPLIGVNDANAYPLYRPTIRINEMTPSTFQEIPVQRLRQQSELKQRIRGGRNLPRFIE